jgi:hypothetical protein
MPLAQRLSRRALLRRSAAAAALASAAGAGVFCAGHAGRYPEPSPACTLKFLAPREYAIVAALADTLFPPGNPIGLCGTEARVPEYVDRWLAAMQPDKAGEYRAMLLLFEHGTLAFGLRARRFTDLAQSARERYLRHWETSGIYARRALVGGLKTTLGFAYFAYPGVESRLGIARSCGAPADALPREEWS